jgi:hypothetical protein
LERSFGGDPAAVRLGAAFVRGLDAGGVLSIINTFRDRDSPTRIASRTVEKPPDRTE